jgi:hypothetical protein
MVDAVVGRHPMDIERIDSLKAPDVVAVLLGIRTPLVVGVDAAVGAEIVLGRVRVELVELEAIGSLDDAKATQWHGSDHCTLATAD